MFHQQNNTKHVVKIFNASQFNFKIDRSFVRTIFLSFQRLEFVNRLAEVHEKRVANVTTKSNYAGKKNKKKTKICLSFPRTTFSSDGKTYRNYCHLKEASKLAKIEQKATITVVKRKPCDSGRTTKPFSPFKFFVSFSS